MPHERVGLWSRVSGAGLGSERALLGVDARVALRDLASASSVGGRRDALRDRSVLVATHDQLTAALALIELDGIARRIVLCPPDLPREHVPAIMATAEVDAVVSDRPDADGAITCSAALVPAPSRDESARHRTEWILLTSGTTGVPKMVVHTLETLTGAIAPDTALAAPAVWSTFYDIRRYGGLQIFLRALLGGGALVLSSAEESTGEVLLRTAAHRVSHISGTPSHRRRARMRPLARRIAPRYVRLSGEIADQAILDHLHAVYPEATIGHAFASTEAGVAFAVRSEERRV